MAQLFQTACPRASRVCVGQRLRAASQLGSRTVQWRRGTRGALADLTRDALPPRFDGGVGPRDDPTAAPESGSTYAHVAGLPLVDRALRAAAPRARHDERVHEGLDRRAAQRRRPRRRGRGHHVGPDRPDRVPPGRGRPDVVARDAHVRRVLEAARPGQPLSGRPDPRQRPLLPPVGVRERGARPRPAPERPLAAGRHRPPGPAGQLRGIGPDRRPAEPSARSQLLLRADPGLRFKLDPTPSWDDDLRAQSSRASAASTSST